MRLVMLVAVAAALVAGCGGGEPSVVELKAIEDLRERFNEDAGRPRLILVLSPS